MLIEVAFIPFECLKVLAECKSSDLLRVDFLSVDVSYLLGVLIIVLFCKLKAFILSNRIKL